MERPDVDSEFVAPSLTFAGEGKAPGPKQEDLAKHESTREFHAKPPGQMVVAEACFLNSEPCAVFALRRKRNAQQGFQAARDVGRGEAEVLVPALHSRNDKRVGEKPLQVSGSGGRLDARAIGQLFRGEGASFHQQVQHANSSGVADRTCQSSDIGFRGHASMMNELFPRDKQALYD